MAPRLNKRQQRELEELEILGTAQKVEEPSSEEEAEIIPVKPAGGFAAVRHSILISALTKLYTRRQLFSADSEEDAPESEADEKPQPTKNKKVGSFLNQNQMCIDTIDQSKKKKKKAAAAAVNPETPPEIVIKLEKSAGQIKPVTKKGKGKERIPEKDDLDQALAELSVE